MRPVAIDGAGVSIAIGRSHAWVPRGQEYVEASTNWGDNLTPIGAVRVDGWPTLGTCRTMTTAIFNRRVATDRPPRLRRGLIVLLYNLRAHKSPYAQRLIEACGAFVRFLPLYSHDFNPLKSSFSRRLSQPTRDWRDSRSCKKVIHK